MDNIPVAVRNTGSNNQSNQPGEPTRSHRPKRRHLKKIIVLIVILAVIIAGALAALRLFGSGLSGSQIETGKYQALFLTNGQVYFGKLALKGDDTYVLTNIFYLQTDTTTDSQNPQKTDEKTDTDNVKLIKLGSEVHGPEDKMIVNREQVLFFENLKKDGKVSSSIDQYAANK